jgi:hypothetical protein
MKRYAYGLEGRKKVRKLSSSYKIHSEQTYCGGEGE